MKLPKKAKTYLGMNQKFSPGTWVIIKDKTGMFKNEKAIVTGSYRQFYGKNDSNKGDVYEVFLPRTNGTVAWFKEKELKRIK